MEERGRPPCVRLLLVCCNGRGPGEEACGNRGSAEVHRILKERVRAKGLQGRCRVSRSLCLGLCAEGPVVAVLPENAWYSRVAPSDAEGIARKWIDPLA